MHEIFGKSCIFCLVILEKVVFFVRTSLVLIFVDFCVNFFQRKTV